MRNRIVFLFAGQGSQYYQMGRELYRAHGGFRRWIDLGSALVEPVLGCSLAELIYRDRPSRFEPFDRTLYTHPAIYLVNYGVAQMLQEEGVVPSVMVGYSLGEVAALAAAGAVSFEAGLAYVIESARLIEERTPPGGMLAVLGSASLAAEHPDCFAGTVLAALNYEENFVVSGGQGDVERVENWLKGRGITCLRLPIRHGFHSALLDPIEEGVKSLALRIECAAPRLPVVSCLTGSVVDASGLGPGYWWRVLRERASFARAIAELEASGGPGCYVDVGPSGTLAGFIRHLKVRHPESTALPVLTPYGHDLRSLARLRGTLG